MQPDPTSSLAEEGVVWGRAEVLRPGARPIDFLLNVHGARNG